MPKITIVSVTLCVLVFACLIPVLEAGDTHLVNPDWPAHVRLHHAWQLLGNAAISILAFILAWKNIAPRIGVALGLILSTSFLVAWLTSSLYGGSMVHSDNTELATGGINVGVIVMVLLTGALLLGWRALSRQSGASA